MHQLVNWLDEAKVISVMTGAGISTESGIPDFRSSKGLWTEDLSRTEVMSRSYFERHPKSFWKYFKDIFQTKLSPGHKPNKGHLFLRELEAMGKEVHIFTQNVDGLHQKAGSCNVYNMHGSIQTAECPKCKSVYGLDHIHEKEVPRCSSVLASGSPCDFILKPDVVLFGDMVQHMEAIYHTVDRSELLLVMGTSLEVYPVNQIPKDFRYRGNKKMVLINREPTRLDHLFDLVIHASIGETLEQTEEWMKQEKLG
ncbi:NAD-dependent protein deacylase [Metabacillus sp. KIGAM252]|uniref:protein acetyllysine N-acetyltransferase n=1 Tax=Metabacillus flavus TaxID=2823519 RepID=A0ABS5LBR7_9BACI|nr:NAD-dependent protein deacylase [Metabacillus flavus]